jgi:TolB-like protein/DNA-binding winged helix-turn-helix (wHTH) protein/Flp pilus assembly protein TadD
LVALEDGTVAVSIQSPPQRLCFGKFQLELASGELHQNGHKIPFAPKAFELLRALVERPGQVVTREELRAKLWGSDTFVEFDYSMNHTVKKLRQALGDSAENPQFIETLPRYGYRFIAPVETRTAPARAPEEPARRRRSAKTAIALSVVLSIALAALLAFDVGRWRTLLFGHSNEPPIRSMAVLPLSNLSGDSQQDYFADGMTDALITDLAKIRSLRVISRTSVMQFKDAKKPLPEIARALGVDCILEGSVQRSGSRVRVTAQLIRAPTDTHLWAESYERDARDVLILQGEIAGAVAREIKVTLAPTEAQRMVQARPVDPKVYELYLKGRYEADRLLQEGINKSVDYFQQVIKLDPTFTPAYCGLADSYTTLGIDGFAAGKNVYPKAKEAALKALQLDPNSAEAHASLGFVLFNYDHDYESAIRELETATRLNPNYVLAHLWFSFSLAWLGRSEQAIQEIEYARRLDPLSARINTNVVYVSFLGRQYDRAIAEGRKTLELEPNYAWAHFFLARAYLQKGMAKEAFAEFQERVRLQPNFPKAQADIALAYAAIGDRPTALKIYEHLKRQSKHEYVTPYPMARVCLHLGRKEEALAWLENGLAINDGDMIQIKVDPDYDGLRSDPHFQELLRRMNFPQ